MKTAAGLFLVSFLVCNFSGFSAPQALEQDVSEELKKAVAGVRQATVAIVLRDGKKAVLEYRTISARHEMPMQPGLSDNPEGRAFYEQIRSQTFMKSKLVIDCKIEIAGIALEPGRYGLGLSGFKDGNYDLAIFKGRERIKIPLIMDSAPFDSPHIAFSFASRSGDELALIFHAGRKCAFVPIKVVAKKKGRPGGEDAGGGEQGGDR
jgi:hypothetical protein